MLVKFNSDFENTSWGAIILFASLLLPSVAVAFYCVLNILHGRALETFDLIIMAHPVLTNLGVTYLEVLIGDLITLVAIFVGLFLRYHYYRDERYLMRKYGMKGKTGFTKDFKPSGDSQGHHYDLGNDE